MGAEMVCELNYSDSAVPVCPRDYLRRFFALKAIGGQSRELGMGLLQTRRVRYRPWQRLVCSMGSAYCFVLGKMLCKGCSGRIGTFE